MKRSPAWWIYYSVLGILITSFIVVAVSLASIALTLLGVI